VASLEVDNLVVFSISLHIWNLAWQEGWYLVGGGY